MISFKNESPHYSWKSYLSTWGWQRAVFVQIDSCHSSSHLYCCFSHFYEPKSYKIERYTESTVWSLSHMSNLTCFCQFQLVTLFQMKFRGLGSRWDPEKRNVLVSSALSINKAYLVWINTSPGESLSCISHTAMTRQLNEQAPWGLTLMWLPEPSQMLFTFQRIW